MLLASGGRRYVVADAPATPPTAVIGPDQACTTLRGAPLAETWSRGVRTWANDPDGETVLLTGVYDLPGEVPGRLLRVLPPAVVVDGHAAGATLLALCAGAHAPRAGPPLDARVPLAADLLLDEGTTIAGVADAVGYGSPFALSTAFKRLRGVSPQAHRRAAAAQSAVRAR